MTIADFVYRNAAQDGARPQGQWAGAQRFLWNRLPDAEKAEHQATGKFIWKRGLQPMAVAMEKEPGRAFLADLPAHAVPKVVDDLDGASSTTRRDDAVHTKKLHREIASGQHRPPERRGHQGHGPAYAVFRHADGPGQGEGDGP
jgi:hypothetical protein